MRAGVVLCPEDRKQEGIVAIASVSENMNISRRRHHSALHILDARKEAATTADFIAKLAIKTRDGKTPISKLSGGNQQKVILSRWLAEEIDVFLMDEPTRGIDVGARSEIYGLLYGLAEAGRTVIVVSSDLAEVIGVADRMIVMREGRIVGNLPKAQATPDQLIRLALPSSNERTRHAMQTTNTQLSNQPNPKESVGTRARAARTWDLINKSAHRDGVRDLVRRAFADGAGLSQLAQHAGPPAVGHADRLDIGHDDVLLALGEVDLSVASIVAFAGVTASTLITATHSVTLGIAGGVLAGGAVGLVNGVLIARFRINSLIVTLAMMEVVRGLAYITSHGDAVMISEESFFELGGGSFLGISYPIWSNIVGFVVFGFLLKKTVFGKNVLAVGGNGEAALLAGLPVTRIKITVFVLQGLVTGFAGVMLASRMSLGDPKTSVGWSLA